MEQSQQKLKPRETAPERIVDHRPWGGFFQLAHNEVCSVKILWVEAGKRLSLQSHNRRSELWTVIEGKMEVQINDEKKVVSRDEQVFIPCGAKHRATGLDNACRWIEVAFGDFDENDIIRYEDDYGRD